MAESDGPSGPGKGRDGKRRGPQPPILDLKATEVAAAPGAPAAEDKPQAADPAAPSSPAASSTTAESSPDPVSPPASDPADIGPAPAEEPTADPTPSPAIEPIPDPTSARAGATGHDPLHIPTADPTGDETHDRAFDEERDPARVRERGEEPPSRHRSGWGIAGLALGAGAGAAAGAAGLVAVAWLLGMPLGRDDRTADAARRVAALEARVNEIAARPPPAVDPRVGEVATRVAAIEQTLAQLKALETRVAQAEAALKTVRSSGDAGLTERVAALDKAAKSLADTVADLRRRVDETATLAQAAREAAAQSSSATAAVAETANAVTTLGQRVAVLESATKALQTTLANSSALDRDRRARLATTVVALRAAVESGAPYSTEFAAARALGADAPRLAALEPFAVSGVPGVAVLARELDAVTLAMRKAAEPNRNGGGGFFSWLQTSFGRLVRVRPADGSRPAAAGAGRVQALLARGEIAQAIAEAEALPEAERAPLQTWIDKAKKRTAALNAARDLAHDGVAALASSNGEPAAR